MEGWEGWDILKLSEARFNMNKRLFGDMCLVTIVFVYVCKIALFLLQRKSPEIASKNETNFEKIILCTFKC